ncbi:hypothetical protein F5B22DRAFT_106665 [Xylaria bambusicola]|uniref:uncharacterized protein n=1 Tax=Xylaria bambusicola TaxID=326684 RepID=UPI0020077862|nr:uncharacterized protein F5B22DRAFT_106665 [Xylaria bambusicola]KAI0517483.1 hypothetical protein F5B22DRAFT_106665 [Xylaria bambusicola]
MHKRDQHLQLGDPPPAAVAFSTVARSAIISSQPGLHQNEESITKYAPSMMGTSSSLRVPDHPLLNGAESTLECPYCHMALYVEEMKHRENWKRHVFRDLRPYVCTFSDCTDPERLFTTRRDWKYHEMQLHRRGWICRQCSCHYELKSEMVHRIRHIHNPNIENHVLATLLDVSERPSDESSQGRCPFCYVTKSTKSLLDHMAEHMEELALFSLPQSMVEEVEEEIPGTHFASQMQGDLPDTKVLHEFSNEPTGARGESFATVKGKIMGISLTLAEERVGEEQVKKGKVRGSTQLTVYFCCYCGNGPWNLTVTLECGLCAHSLCEHCRAETITL